MIKRIVSAITALVMAASINCFNAQAADKIDFVKNGGFETVKGDGSPGNWNFVGGKAGTEFTASADAYSGDYSLCLKGSETALIAMQALMPLKFKSEYTLSFYYKIIDAGATEPAIKLEFRKINQDGKTTTSVGEHDKGYTLSGYKPGEWKKYELKFTMPENADCVQILLRQFTGGEYLYDDVKLTGEAGAEVKPVELPDPEYTPVKLDADKPYNNSPNLITNGSFEDLSASGGAGGWDVYKNNWKDNAFVSISSDNAHSGKNCVKIATEEAGNPWVSFKILDVEPDTRYTIIGWENSKVTSGNGAAFKIEYYDKDNQSVGDDHNSAYFPQTYGKWQQVQHTLITPPDAYALKVYCRLYGTGYVCYDDIEAYMTDAPPTFSLKTDAQFCYTNSNIGVTITPNTKSYEDAETYTVDIRLTDDDKTVFERKGFSYEKGEIKYSFPANRMPEKNKEYFLKADSFDKNGKKLQTREKSLYRFDRPSAIGEDGNYYVKGEIFNPVIAYHVAENQYPICKEIGVNVVQIFFGQNANEEEIQEKLDLLDSYGLKALVALYYGGKPAGDPSNAKSTARIVNAVKDSDVVFAYAMQDEPARSSEAGLREGYKIIRSIDSVHPTYICQCLNSLFELDSEFVDIMTTDPYPSFSGSGIDPVTTYPQREIALAAAAVEYQRPTSAILQVFDDSVSYSARYKNWNTTIDEVRSGAYQTFMAGGTYIGYYPMMEPDGFRLEKRPIWEGLKEFKASGELDDMYAVFVNHKYPVFNEYRGNDCWYTIFIKNGEIYMALLSRSDTKDTDVSIPLTSYNGISIDKFKAEVIKGGEGSFEGTNSLSLKLKAKDCLLIKINPDKPIDTSKISVSGYKDLYNHIWSREAVEAISAQGISNALSPIAYEPAMNITRGEFAMYLVRTLKLASESSENFSDVEADAVYTKELAIGKALGILNGVGDNKFNPEAEISRQDMMTIIARGMGLTGDYNLSNYSDAGLIADYALQSVKAMINAGLVKGNADGTINPEGKTTRAEAAVIMERILKR